MKLYQFFDQDSPEYVILHAQYRAKRGKRPSVSFMGISNPREALKWAEAALRKDGMYVMSFRNQCTSWKILGRISQALGFRPATQEDLQEFLRQHRSPKRGDTVPFVEWDRSSRRFGISWNSPRESWSARSAFTFIL